LALYASAKAATVASSVCVSAGTTTAPGIAVIVITVLAAYASDCRIIIVKKRYHRQTAIKRIRRCY
jgi:hypothetical protein